MIKSKKAVTWEFLIGIILLGIILLISFLYVKDIIVEGNYASSIMGCKLFFEQLDGKPAYFGDDLSRPTAKLYDAISNLCSSRDFEIKKETNLEPALGLISDCWKKTGSGEDIFGANVRDKHICLYCGKITSKTEITNFRDLLLEEFEKPKYNYLYSEDVESINLNKVFFERIPQNIGKDKSAVVFYYTYKPEYPPADKDGNINFQTFFRDVVLTKLSKGFGNSWDPATYVNYFLSKSVINTYSGIVVISQEEYYEEDFEDVKNNIGLYGCDVIIPKENIK